MERFWDKVDKTDDCWEWTAKGRRGPYGAFRMCVDGVWKQCLPHRVAWELTYGEIPDGLCVLHACDNPLCVNPEHLSVGTHKENTQDMIVKGRMVIPRGESRGHAKLNETKVKSIRQLAEEGISRSDIAQQFEVHVSVINKAVRRETWSHVR